MNSGEYIQLGVLAKIVSGVGVADGLTWGVACKSSASNINFSYSDASVIEGGFAGVP